MGYGNHSSDEVEIINRTGVIIEFSGIVTGDLIELMEPLELMEWKDEINGSDGLVEIDGNYKADGIDRSDERMESI